MLTRALCVVLFGLSICCGKAVATTGWDYLDISVLTDSTSYSYLLDEKVYLTGGTLDAAVSLHDYLYVRLNSRVFDGRLPLPAPESGYINVATDHWHSAGIGGHLPLKVGDILLQPWVELSLNAYSLGDTGTGLGAATGMRVSWHENWELGGWYRMANTSFRAISSADIKPRAYGLDLSYRMSERYALRVGRSWTEVKLSSSGISLEHDVQATEIGIRYLYDPAGYQRQRSLEPLSYNQVSLNLAATGKAKIEDTRFDQRYGMDLAGSFSPLPNFFVAARYHGSSFDLSNPTNSAALTNQFAIGPGGYYTHQVGNIALSGYGQVTYNRMLTIESLAPTGYGYALGVRAGYGTLADVHLFHNQARTKASTGLQDFRIEPAVTGIEFAVTPLRNGLGFTLGYQQGTVDTKFGSFSTKLKARQLGIGLRQQF